MMTELHAILDLLTMLVLEPRIGILIALLLIAAWFDYSSSRIPNWLSFGGMAVGLACGALWPAPQLTAFSGLMSSLGGLGIGLAALLPFHLMRAMGAGDVKLMAMCGAFLGFPDALAAVLASLAAGGLLSLGYMAWKRKARQALRNIGAMVLGFVLGRGLGLSLADRKNSVGTLPYGLAIAAGTIGYLVLRQLGLLG